MRERRLVLIAVTFAILLSSCACRAASDVNSPLAQVQIESVATFDSVNSVITEFSQKSHFAVQVLPLPKPSNTDFSVRLFRDDLTVTINKIRGGPIDVAAFPLCACERDRRFGLQSAADDVISELRARLAE